MKNRKIVHLHLLLLVVVSTVCSPLQARILPFGGWCLPDAVGANVRPMPYPMWAQPMLQDWLILHGDSAAIAMAMDSTTLAALDSIVPRSVVRDRNGDYLRDSIRDPFLLPDPPSVQKNIEYDEKTNRYIVTERIGDDYYRTPTVLTFEEYVKWKNKNQEQAYFERLAGVGRSRNRSLVDPISKIDFSQTQNNTLKSIVESFGGGKILPDKFPSVKQAGDWFVKTVLGGSQIDLRKSGNVDLTIGGDYHRYDNPILPIRARTTGGLIFDMAIQFNVTGKIGEKIDLNTSFNNRAQFDFDRLIKLGYNSDKFGEDAILKKIELGNVSLPLKGTLIQGSQNLFGAKVEMQFGYLRLTALAATQQSRRQQLNIQGGAQVQNFSVAADQYDENHHFFITHYNRDHYENALSEMPVIKSLFTIQEIEVWRSNERNEDKEVRQIIALADLGEPTRLTNPSKIQQNPAWNRNRDFDQSLLPGNEANNLYTRLQADTARGSRRLDKVIRIMEGDYELISGQDFVKKSAVKLSPNEYQYNPQLGTITVANLDRVQTLAVSIKYYYNGHGPDPANPTRPYQIGEFSGEVAPFTDSTMGGQARVLFTKLLKSSTQVTDVPLWDLMMKNVYAVNAYVQNPQDFRFDIYYQDVSTDRAEKRFLPENGLRERPLLSLFNLDRLNSQNDQQPDGQFDFVPGITINPRNGRVFFPVLEPFGKSLKARIDNVTGDTVTSKKYIYTDLYTNTLIRAQEKAEKNRFIMRGSAKSSVSSDISLGAFGLKPGALRVSAGGRQLVENVDYEVNYGVGTLKILNSAYLSPDLPLSISYEDQSLFSFQTRTMLGVRADYQVSKNFNIGATYLNLFETPFTQKVNFGEDPINNRVYGVDVNLSKNAPWLTKFVDALPFISTKEPSKITFTGEAAYLQPGYAAALNFGEDAGGTVYVDDFEGSTSPFALGAQTQAWVIASVPQKNVNFPEAASRYTDSTIIGVNRALLNWYRVDLTLVNKLDRDNGNPYTRIINQQEIFPGRTNDQNSITGGALYPFDINYNPTYRGPYNFDLPTVGYPGISKGMREGNQLNNPETRWAGIMRGMSTPDFEQANIEYLDFWLLDPYIGDTERENAGKIYINIGDISEDILRDSRKSYENGLPTPINPTTTDFTRLGRVPRTEIVLPPSFASDAETRGLQDVGLDGMPDSLEKSRFSWYTDKLRAAGFNNAAMYDDPSNDNFVFFNNTTVYNDNTPILERYRRFNMTEGNSAQSEGVADNQLQSATNRPDNEDINNDNSFEENEAYYEYELPIAPKQGSDKGIVKNEFEIESIESPGRKELWYHYKIPIDRYKQKIGAIEGFRSMRFMRMYVKGFKNQTTLRFAKFDLVRNQWRRYKRDSAIAGGGNLDPFGDQTQFEVNSVNVEDNSKRVPFNYVVPPGIDRQNLVSAFAANALQNEQALSLRICGLRPQNRRSVFKLLNMDMRQYQRVKMFVHAEPQQTTQRIPDKKMSVFLRMGSDFENNYYEYEIPLTMSKTDLNLPANSAEYRENVWLKENRFDFPLSLLTELKTERNRLNKDFLRAYTIEDPEKAGNLVRIVGNPNLGQIKGFMIGVKNNDQSDHCVEVWVNELRVNGFNDQGGGAALARMDVKLADFGNVTVSGNYTGVGYGGLEQKIQQRSLEEVIQYDISGEFQLGKLFPEKSGIRARLFTQYSNSTRTPQYDPFDLDLKLKEKVNAARDDAARDSIRQNALTIQEVSNFSLSNIRKERTNSERKPTPFDIENFSASYAHTNTTKRDPLIQADVKDAYKGGLDYAFSRGETKYIEPFKKLITKDKYLKFLSTFNFNLIPNSFGANTIIDRQLNSTTYRFAGEDPRFNTYTIRRFTWDRNYNLTWDLTRSIKMNYDAKNQSIIDELNDFDVAGRRYNDDERNTELWKSIGTFGRTKRYDQTLNLTYQLPFKLIPFMDWVTARASYAATYGWDANTRQLQATQGNAIRNTQNRQLSSEFNFDNLYNYSKYLKKINSPRIKPAAAPKSNIKSRNKKNATLPNENGGDDTKVTPQKQVDSTEAPKPKKAMTAAERKAERAKKKANGEDDEPSLGERILLRPLMTLRKARINYTEAYNSLVPGYLPESRNFGMNNFNSPGWDYVLGYRTPDEAWLDRSAQSGWISTDLYQNRPVLNNYTQTFDGRVMLEPFNDFKVELDASRNFTRNQSEVFRDTVNGGSGRLFHTEQKEMGSLTVSYFALNTLFKNTDDIFEQFKSNRQVISNDLAPNAQSHPDAPGYKLGYGPDSRDVVLPAFLAAYTGTDAKKQNRDLFSTLPQFNWRLTYVGLTKLPFFSDYFSSINITHGYKSTLTVSQYANELNYNRQASTLIPNSSDYYAQYNIPAVVITENFVPLIGIDARLKNDMTFGIQYRKSRTLALSLGDKKLNESNRTDLTITFAHRLKNVVIAFITPKAMRPAKAPKVPRNKKDAKANPNDPANAAAGAAPQPQGGNFKGNDLELKFDLSFVDDRVINRELNILSNTPSRGAQTLRFSPSAKYTLNKNIDVRMFFDFDQTYPYTTIAFPQVNARGGLTISLKIN